uniref:Tensin 3 n=1 Tax=Oncorhynchus kisutch TaxID=8019 RepID=A0A8C7I5I9_ONCKI
NWKTTEFSCFFAVSLLLSVLFLLCELENDQLVTISLMDEGYELDLTYVTERIIAVSFPRTCSEEIYLHNLKDVTRMLKSKHADNYLIINLSEKRHDLSKMNPKTLDTGWPDLHAPPLDKICTICKAMEGWLNADPLHVVVIHCRVSSILITLSSPSHHLSVIFFCADQALDRFAMRKYYDDKVSALMTPSQKRYVWILNSLLGGSMKMNASPLFLHCIILHGIPNFNPAGVCRPYLKVYQGMQAVYSSGVKCYHKSDVTSEREVIFRLQFHTGAVQGYNLMFEKEDMETANKEPRFPDYGKVELVFSEGPEKIPGAERWQNGADVSVDYNTADPLTRWDSYQNINDGEVPRSQGLAQDKAALSKRSANGGGSTNMTLGRGAHRATSITSSPDHSDHALSASSDSGLSSTSLWTDRPPVPIATSTRSQQGPSRQEKAQLKRLLSGFGLEEPSRELEEMSECGGGGPGGVAFQRLVQVQVHVVGDPRPPRERETDILDDLVLLSGHDLHSVDSLGTLSSSCHKSSQNSLLSDGFGSPGGEELQHQPHHQPQHHHPAPAAMEEYERAYAEARRGCLGQRSAPISASTPASTVPMPKQQVYLQGSYSTHTWVRQQQMVAAHQYAYLQAEEGEERERYPGDNKQQEGSPPKPPASTVPQQSSVLRLDTAVQRTVMALPQTHTEQSPAVVNKNKRDEEFNSLTVDIDNSIDQLNQLIMDLDPTFMPVPTRSSSVKRNGGTGMHVNGSATITTTTATSTGCPNGVSHRLMDNSTAPLQSTQQSGKTDSKLWHGMLFRSDSVDYRAQGPEMDSGVEAGSDMTPPTPAFPISPPTPYGKSLLHCLGPFFKGVCVIDDSGLGSYGTADCPVSASPLLGNGGMERGMLMSGSMDQQGTTRTQQHQQLQAQGALPPLLPEKRRASDGEHSLGTASPAPSGFSSPHSGSSLSIPFPNVLPDLSASTQMPDVLAIKQVTVKFVQDTSKFWYKSDISRDQAISVLKDKEPGCFIVRDSHSFRGAYGLAMKVATPPPSVLQQTKRGGDLSNELVRHFLIECTQKGVRLKGCPNEPYFGSLTALVCQHSITPLALPCKLIIPDRDPLEDMVENTTTQSITNSAAELLKQGAACNVWFLGSVEMESLTGYQAVQKATSVTLGSDPLGSDPLPTSTVVHFKVSSQGITLTDNQRKLFFRRHYAVNTVIFCALDPQDRKWKKDGCTSAKIFGFVARKTGSGQDNVCHLFAEHDPEQPASAIVNFVSKVMIGSQKTK